MKEERSPGFDVVLELPKVTAGHGMLLSARGYG